MNDASSALALLYDETSVLVAMYDGQDRPHDANPAFRPRIFLDQSRYLSGPTLMRRNFGARRGTVIRARNFEAWLTSTLPRRGTTGFHVSETDLVDGRCLGATETV